MVTTDGSIRQPCTGSAEGNIEKVESRSPLPPDACGDFVPRFGAIAEPSGVEPDASADSSGSPVGSGLSRTATPVPTTPRIVALGDSLTAGLGHCPRTGLPGAAAAKAEGVRARDRGRSMPAFRATHPRTGLRRASWALEGDVRLLILALGANDGLRGLPAAQMKENLQGVIHRARQRGIPVLLVGMEAPPNYGEQYAASISSGVSGSRAREQDRARAVSAGRCRGRCRT